MKLIFTYDSTELDKIGRLTAFDENVVEEKHVLTIDNNETDDNGKHKPRKLYDVAKDIKSITEEIGDDTSCIIFINQYLGCADEDFQWLQHNAGIALIKFLRMMEVRDHIVLITPYTKLQLVRENPANLIITSKGITCKKYLHKFLKKSFSTLKAAANEQFDEKQELKPYLKVDFELPQDERHNWANWWGVMQLADVNRSVFPGELQFRHESKKERAYPGNLDERLNEIKNRQALWLYGHKANITQTVEKEVIQNHAEIIENEKKPIKELERVIKKLTKEVQGTGKKNPGPDDTFDLIMDWRKTIRINKSKPHWNQKTKPVIEEQIRKAEETLATKQESLDQQEKELSDKKAALLSLEEELQRMKGSSGNSIHVSGEIKEKISILRFTGSDKPRILYIDDLAKKGWSEILQTMLYGEADNDSFDDIVPDKNQDTCSIYDAIKDRLDAYHLILLDLRLQNEGGTQYNVEKLSGGELLTEIRADFPGLPVMMTTASNKSYSFEQLQRLGCDAYWMKEGIDLGFSTEESVRNYMRFLELIQILTGEKYSFLRTFSQEVTTLKESKKSWWESPDWPNKDKDDYRKNLQVDKDIVFQILDDSLLIIRDYLRMDAIHSVYGEASSSWLYPTLIIQNLAKIVEHIHGIKNSNPTTGFIFGVRRDINAKELLDIRAAASHYNDAIHTNFDTVKNFINNLIHYLKTKPRFVNPGKKEGKRGN